MGQVVLIKEDQLIKMIMESQDVLAGNIYKSINAATRIAEGLPELNWLVENRIPKTDLTIIGGKPKVGKTRLSIGLARCLLMGEEFLDVKPAGLSKIILITDDQSDADSGQMMQAAGIYEHPNLYWSKKFRYTENDINRVLKDIKTFDEPIVILDSFRSTTRTTGVRENDQEAGMILYDLKHAITEEGGTFILLHHANKETAADVIELMKLAKLCKKSVLKKSDFINKELNIYTKINRYINEFIEANLVIEIGNKQKHLFGATTRSFCLSEKGAAFVDGLNLNF
jgi:archaellum biogenesis ATPase FlaH